MGKACELGVATLTCVSLATQDGMQVCVCVCVLGVWPCLPILLSNLFSTAPPPFKSWARPCNDAKRFQKNAKQTQWRRAQENVDTNGVFSEVSLRATPNVKA